MSDTAKEYSNGEIAVVWKKEKCIHAGECVRTLPGVFKAQERPWISVNNADTPHLKEAIAKCPSGALSWKVVDQSNEASDSNQEEENTQTNLNIFTDGPICVEGDFKLLDGDGNELEVKNKIFLCRCGASANKPFCDGAHKKAGFKA